jgi:acetylornithine/succinyldiaminopimelate/putrescine aminotransferase
VLLEVVQGEGGVNVADGQYLKQVRQLCDERDMLLMFDEVQTGFARTGEWFAWQHHFDSTSETRPDVVTMAKALGNGVPIGAIWAKREVAAAFEPGDHATTYGGQPLATSAARAVLRVMEAIDAPSRARAVGDDLMGRLLEVPNVIDTRGLGLLIAAEIDTEVVGMTGPEIALSCLDAGLVVNGITPTAIRLTPPLTVSSEEIDEALEILSAVLGGS